MSNEPEGPQLGTVEVLIVKHPAGFVSGCKKCRTILSQGNFAIGIKIVEKGRKFSYFLRLDPQPVCCDEAKSIIRAFATAEEAVPLQQEIIDHLARTNSTEGLHLLNWVIPANN